MTQEHWKMLGHCMDGMNWDRDTAGVERLLISIGL
jgi:hypothetical protein